VPKLGYTLSCEEHRPNDLVRNARAAEEAGFAFATISDHFHPWTDRQGQSPFVWSVIGGVAQATQRLRLGTGVTCPLIRIHPAIVAQAAATSAVMMEGRFFLGVGTGEELNEHVTGARWPGPDARLEMLEEAIEVMRLLWEGGYRTHRGTHYTVEQARIFTLPDELVPIAVAASQPAAAQLAGRLGDALISVSPDEELVRAFDEAGGTGKPRYGQLHVCYAESEEQARKTAHPQIFIGRSRVEPWAKINRQIDELGQLAEAGDAAALVAKIKEVVPEYEQHAPAYRDPSPCPLPAPAPAKPELVPAGPVPALSGVL
jgi:G6PDH family F420-dependent oxidoreductase